MSSLAVTPDSSIRLLRCPLKLDNLNQITFASVNAQTTYFQSLPYLYDNNLSYIRKDGVIRVSTTASGTGQLTYEDLITYNYVMYQNTHYDNKWFYAYITNIKYINDGCTELSIETDYFQTWQFDIVWKNTFIEREHVNDDTTGSHTIPENIETGEYYSNGYEYIDDLDDIGYIICATTSSNPSVRRVSTNMGGVVYPGDVYYCANVTNFENVLQQYRSNSADGNIYAVYTIPQLATTSTSTTWEHLGNQSGPINVAYEYNKPTTLNGYTPKNNKLKTFPYMYCLVSNNNGQSTILKWEHWTTTKATFSLALVPTIGGNYKLTPTSYEAGLHNNEYSVMGGKLPTLGWSQDLFTNWTSSNAVNLGIGVGGSVLSIIGGAGMMASGGGSLVGAGMITAGISGIASSIGQVYQHDLDPYSAKGNVNGGDINFCCEENGFYIYKMTIKYEYAKMIDDYFSMYGYKVNRLGTPHIHVRSKWDYLKTINCNLGGNIPNQDLNALCNMCNTGITFWHDTTNFLNYSATNSILT